jgi:Pectate lyase superfamily protein
MTTYSSVFGTLSVKDPTYGAVGNGVANDGPAIQACFDAAFGTAASPHGIANKALNRAVYFPGGTYNVGAPLYLNKVASGQIFGAGANCTRLSYTGALSGNTVSSGSLSGPDAALLHAITPLIITDGFSYSKFEGINLAISGANTAAFFLYWDGTGGAGPTSNSFSDLLLEGATTGMLIGYLTPGLCSEQTFKTCVASGCTDYGFRNISANALNNAFLNCGAASCGVGFSSPTGTIAIYCASLAGNGVDIEANTNPITIIGSRTESANFVNLGLGQCWAHISGCEQADTNQAGYFVNLENGSQAVIDSCVQEDTLSTAGKITGSNSRVYLRGNDFRNTAYLSSFTGVVSELDIPNGLVSALPTADAKYKGLRALVTDATSTTFNGTAVGTGSFTVPVWCDGAAWKIG